MNQCNIAFFFRMALHSVLVETCWTTVEYLAVLHEITPEKLFEFSQVFFRSVKILGLFQGNISQVQSLELCEKFKTILCCSPLEGEKPCVR